MDKPRELKMWLAVRQDIEMSPGKLATQAGHAYGGLYMNLLPYHEAGATGLFGDYLKSGTPKITVKADSQKHIERIYHECSRVGIPSYVVRDAGRTELERGTMTVIAFGPAYRDELPKFLQRLQLL